MITIYFKLLILQPDQRKFKTASPTLEPTKDLIIAVNIPDKNEYIHNLSDMTLALTSGNKQPEPILTPLGLAYIEDQLLSRIDQTDEGAESDEDEIKWEDEEDG